MRKHLLRAFVPYAVAYSTTLVVVLITDSWIPWIGYGGFIIGWIVGSYLNYRWGMKDRMEIIDDVYGQGWEYDWAVGRLENQKRKAPMN